MTDWTSQLNLVSIALKIWAAIHALSAVVLLLIGVAGGIWPFFLPEGGFGEKAMVGGFFGAFPLAFGVFLALVAWFTWKAAIAIVENRSLNLIIVMSIVTALTFPIGTAIGGYALYLVHQADVRPRFTS